MDALTILLIFGGGIALTLLIVGIWLARKEKEDVKYPTAEKPHKKWPLWLGLLIAVIVVSCFCLAVNIIQTNNNHPDIVTLAEFNRIQTGMSYSQVVGIIGAPGTEISRSEIGGYLTIMYQWQNEISLGNMNAMFQNGALVSKAQFGLK
jgi:ABC-type uncharacterized transport system permease subunit